MAESSENDILNNPTPITTIPSSITTPTTTPITTTTTTNPIPSNTPTTTTDINDDDDDDDDDNDHDDDDDDNDNSRNNNDSNDKDEDDIDDDDDKKEEHDESASEISNLPEYYQTAKTAYSNKHFEEVIKILPKYLTEISKIFGDLSQKLAEPYLIYGQSLLNLGRKSAKIFGEGIQPIDEDKIKNSNPAINVSDDDDDDDTKAVEDIQTEKDENVDDFFQLAWECLEVSRIIYENNKSELSKNSNTMEQVSEVPINSNIDLTKEKHDPQNSNNTKQTEEEEVKSKYSNKQTEEDNNKQTEEEVKSKYSNNDDHDDTANLSDVYYSLGELLTEQGHYNLALEDYLKCLELQKIIFPESRLIAATYFSIGYLNELLNNFTEAEVYFSKAKAILKNIVNKLSTEISTKSENSENITSPENSENINNSENIKDSKDEVLSLEEFISEIDSKLTECQEQIINAAKNSNETENVTKNSNETDVTNNSNETDGTINSTSTSLLADKNLPKNSFDGVSNEFSTTKDITHQIRRKKRGNSDYDDDKEVVKKAKNSD